MTIKVFLLAALLLTTPIANQAQAEWGNDNITKDTSDKTSCVPKRVQEVLKAVQAKFKKVTIKSGYRAAADNARRGGAKGSQHIKCNAIDFLIPGRESRNTQQQLATFLQQQKGSGGMRYNVYCTGRAHVDNSNLRDGYKTCVRGAAAGKNYKRAPKYPG